MIEIRLATLEDADALAPLFDAYRQFYRRETDLSLARRFLHDRLSRGESAILMAGTTRRRAGALNPRFHPALSQLFVDPRGPHFRPQRPIRRTGRSQTRRRRGAPGGGGGLRSRRGGGLAGSPHR